MIANDIDECVTLESDLVLGAAVETVTSVFAHAHCRTHITNHCYKPFPLLYKDPRDTRIEFASHIIRSRLEIYHEMRIT